MYMKIGRKDYVYVSLQLFLFVVYVQDISLIHINIHRIISFIGATIAVIGVLITLIAVLQQNTYLSPFPTPKSNASLITNGTYRFIRHPIYTGIILSTFGYGLYTDSLYRIIISLLLYLLFYFKSSYEEERLKIVFSDYASYCKKRGRFFPKI